MPHMLAGSLIVDAALLAILVTIVARHSAEWDMLSLVLVAGGCALGGLIIEWQLAEALGLGTLVLHALLCGVLLIRFTGATLVQAAIIVVMFFAIKIGLRFAMAYVLSA